MSNHERTGMLTLVVPDPSLQADDENERACAILRVLHNRLTAENEKKMLPGSLAKWKPGLRNRVSPQYGHPCVVIELVGPTIIDTKFNSGSPYFREPLSMIIGVTDEDGDFVAYHVDARRFEPYERDCRDRNVE